MRYFIVILLLAVLVQAGILIECKTHRSVPDPKAPAKAEPAEERNWYRVVPKTIHDADTISKGDIELGLGVWLVDQGFRPDDYDAWEVSTLRSRGNPSIKITPEEIQRGKDAKKEFEGLCGLGTLYVSPNPRTPREKYGRILGPWKLVLSDGEVILLGEYAREHDWQRSQKFELERE